MVWKITCMAFFLLIELGLSASRCEMSKHFFIQLLFVNDILCSQRGKHIFVTFSVKIQRYLCDFENNE
jgi:hypothetical protein